ncbi:MAG TPA: cytochrome c [Trueperaceae bacterium]|nr:cytochrome c [Trueperaceae bacterium]
MGFRDIDKAAMRAEAVRLRATRDEAARVPGSSRKRWLTLGMTTLLMVLLSSCGRNMFDQAKAEPFDASPYFADGASMRPLVPNTVSREFGALEPAYLTGMDANGMLTELPVELSLELLHRGQERFDIYCSPCHNYNGNGLGATVRRGFPQPTSFTTTDRLLDAPVGYFYSAITNGFGRMYSYASRIPVEDRWAISAYVKALQLSQNASADDIPDGAVLTAPGSTEASR